jgi:hypothetical protein
MEAMQAIRVIMGKAEPEAGLVKMEGALLAVRAATRAGLA